ncbi:MAG: GGDEF domain-containing protein, partial [Pseudomonadales bacterium]
LETGRTDVVGVANGFLPSATTTTAGDILVVDDVGFHALQWPARWTVVDSKHGLAGSVNRIESVDGRTYVLTSSGAFVTEIGDAQFRQLAWTDYEAWDMLVLDDGNILFADSYQIKLISPEGQITIVDDRTTARLFLPSRFDKDIVYVGSEFGIQVLRRQNGAWRAIFKLEDMDNLTVTQIVEATPSELWIGSTRGGVRRINIDDITSETADITMMTAADGIDYGSLPEGAYIYQIDGEMLASTSAGIFHWKGERFEPDSLNGLADLRTPGKTVEFAIKDNELWAYHFNRLFQFSGAWSEEDVSGLRIGAISSIDFVDNRVLVGGLGSILLLNPDAVTAPTPNAPLNLTAASLYKAVEGNLVVESVSFDSITISSRDERLNLRFSLPDFRKPDDVRYRTRLSPAEANYSPWSETSQQSFVKLAPGEYSLQVLGRDSSGRVADLTIPITVMPQWFETTTLRALAFALIFILAYFSVIQLAKRRSRILALERDQLEEIVAERTRALQSANRQLDKMAHLDGLTQIPNRRRLESYLEDVRLHCVEHGRVMALAIIDVDRFKEFNDTFGHQAGDSLLIDLAKLLSRNLRRAEDLVARYGGEEFLVVLPGADPDTALRVIEEMREKVAASELNVTISAGLHVTLPLDDTQMSDLIKTADEALYRAKSEGRNRVMVG